MKSDNENANESPRELSDANENPRELSVSEATPTGAKEVFPCCCGLSPETFFYCFTILILVDQILSVLNCLGNFFIHLNAFYFVTLAVSVGMLVWISLVLAEYRKTGEYGTFSAYALAMTCLIFAGIAVGFTVLLLLFFLIAGKEVFKNVSESLHNLEAAYGIVVVGLIVAVLFLAYLAYLFYLYLDVIRQKRAQNENKSAEKDAEPEAEEGALEKTVDQPEVSAEAVPQVEDKNDLETNLA